MKRIVPLLIVACLLPAVPALAADTDGQPSTLEKVEAAVGRGAHAAASGVERGARAAARGMSKGVDAAASGVKRGAEATRRAVGKAADKVLGSPASSASGPAP